MDINDILTLTKAGFTAKDISALLSAQSGQEPEKAPAQDPEQAPAQEPEQAPAQEPEQGGAMAAVLDRLDKLIANLQALAIANSRQPYSDPGEDVDKILASIINPTGGKK